MSMSGEFLDEFSIPEYYKPTVEGTKGIYNNKAFEGVALSSNNKRIFVATENSLIHDGEKASLLGNSLSRILEYDLTNDNLIGEYV